MREDSRSSDVGGLLLLSLIVMLNLPLAFPLWMGMDQYGLYTVDAIARVQHLPLALAAIIDTSLAFLGYYAYKRLRARPDYPLYRDWRAFYRHIFIIGVPVAIAKVPAFVLAFDALKPYFIVAGVLMVASLAIVALLRESDVVTSPGIAAAYSVTVILVTLTMVAMSIALLLVIFPMDLIPPTGNFLWEWRFDWSDIYYAREDFVHRARVALVFFGVSTCVYMAAVMGYAMLDAIYTQMKAATVPPADSDADALRQESAQSIPLDSLPDWGVEVLERLEWRDGDAQDYYAVFDGEKEVGITAEQYNNLLLNKDSILSEADLLVNRATSDGFSKVEGHWERFTYRRRRETKSGLSGTFSLLCIHARNPRHRFETDDLVRMLNEEIKGSGTNTVADLRNRLKERRFKLRDGSEVDAVHCIRFEYDQENFTSFISEGVKVCYIYRNEKAGVSPLHP